MNPLLGLFRRTQKRSYGVLDWPREPFTSSLLEIPGIPLELVDHLGWSLIFQFRREVAVPRYGFAVPTRRPIAQLVKLSPLVEIGAGRAYWARLITEAGGDVVCYDRWRRANTYHRVSIGGPRKLRKHADRNLFLCWPDFQDRMAAECLRYFRGRAYVGEGAGGCTADDRFHELLDRHFVEQADIVIPRWEGIHDTLMIWRRR